MKVEISNGELVDKVTILHIKKARVEDPTKVLHIEQELDMLLLSMFQCGISEKDSCFQELLEINARLWAVEDRIREKELHREFDDEFIDLARTMYYENDRRAGLKKSINLMTGSELIEEKQYSVY